MSAELYLLEAGRYRLRLSQGAQADAVEKFFTVEGRRTRVSFTLTPGELCVLDIRAAE